MKTQKNSQKPKQVLFMTRIVTILISIIVFCTIPVAVFANAPSGLTVSYDLGTQDLQVTITHPVNNPTTHYIYKVELQKNGLLFNTSTYTNQPDSNSFTYTYRFNATTGDTIDVTASCIQGGSKTTHYTVSTINGEKNTSTPGFESIVALSAIIFIVILLRRKQI
jgi:hypothetical protein